MTALEKRPAIVPVPVVDEHVDAVIGRRVDLHLHHIGIRLVYRPPKRHARLQMPVELGLVFKQHRFPLTDAHRPKLPGPHVVMIGSWIEAADYLFTISKSIFELRQSERDASDTDLISRIRQYVEKHLDGDLSLVKLAEQISYNPSYLSRIFKQMTGINLISYINKARLEKAKELLLKQTSANILEIAKSTGFDSSQYFATVFKKNFGMTPQEYRNLYLNG